MNETYQMNPFRCSCEMNPFRCSCCMRSVHPHVYLRKPKTLLTGKERVEC